MSWGDTWDSRPWSYHERLAKAFYEGRECYGNKGTYVKFHEYIFTLEYWYNGGVIARWLAPSSIIERAAHKLATGTEPWKPFEDNFPDEPQYRAYRADKGEARHLKALGINAEWQWGGKPFLIEGADVTAEGFMTKAQWQAAEKWTEPTPQQKLRAYRSRLPVPFDNRTLPLFT